jgi:GntR family transcriptional repressor for pyruvate dehydrogenase complex
MLATARDRRNAVAELRGLIEAQQQAIADPAAFGKANANFHERLVALAGNQTLTIVAEMLNEIVERAVTAVSQSSSANGSLAIRRRGIRSQERLVELIAHGAGNEVELHWRAHMEAVGKVILGQRAKHVVDLFDHY